MARDPAALELRRVQRGRRAERMRPPWWYLSGVAIVWSLAFACPFSSRFLPQGFRIRPILLAGVAVVCLLLWGLRVIDRDLLAAAVAVAVLAVVAEVACQQAQLRGIRRDLRAGRRAA